VLSGVFERQLFGPAIKLGRGWNEVIGNLGVASARGRLAQRKLSSANFGSWPEPNQALRLFTQESAHHSRYAAPAVQGQASG